MVAKAGGVVGIHLRPHDLRRHAATYASRSGVPIEIVSKIILRHSNLSTTERYLGKISDVEAMKKPSYNWNIIEKETVDEIIFRTSKPRNRLMLELMARGGMVK